MYAYRQGIIVIGNKIMTSINFKLFNRNSVCNLKVQNIFRCAIRDYDGSFAYLCRHFLDNGWENKIMTKEMFLYELSLSSVLR